LTFVVIIVTLFAMVTDSELIDTLGGTSKVSKDVNLTSQAVSRWRVNGIPRPWKKYFQAIHPELFGPPPDIPRLPDIPSPAPSPPEDEP
jgi:hypothetical protein